MIHSGSFLDHFNLDHSFLRTIISTVLYCVYDWISAGIDNPGRSVATGKHVAYQADEMVLSGKADDWTPAYSW